MISIWIQGGPIGSQSGSKGVPIGSQSGSRGPIGSASGSRGSHRISIRIQGVLYVPDPGESYWISIRVQWVPKDLNPGPWGPIGSQSGSRGSISRGSLPIKNYKALNLGLFVITSLVRKVSPIIPFNQDLTFRKVCNQFPCTRLDQSQISQNIYWVPSYTWPCVSGTLKTRYTGQVTVSKVPEKHVHV